MTKGAVPFNGGHLGVDGLRFVYAVPGCPVAPRDVRNAARQPQKHPNHLAVHPDTSVVVPGQPGIPQYSMPFDFFHRHHHCGHSAPTTEP